jgi:penicillin-insensitive murein endopeptidase
VKAASRSWLVPVTALACSGCFGTPTPLAPGVSGSVGLPHHGVQTDGVELPVEGPGFMRFRKAGGFYWGQPGLVRAIQSVALQVREHMPDGAPLLVGDLSARGGGRIPRHNSHRSGRDVDLLWYVTTPSGAPIENPGFVLMGADGLAQVPSTGEFVSIDIPRQWLLIKALLSSSEIEVQWMFVSSAIESMLIDYALARGDDPETIWRAGTVMLQPADSLPHDDHLHLRVACSPDATSLGCEGGGPYWDWLPPPPLLDPMSESALSELIAPDERFEVPLTLSAAPLERE